MFSKISVLVPTRHRLGRLQTLLESYARTTRDDPDASELVFRIDEDDEESQGFFADSPHTVLTGPRLQGYGSTPAFFNELAAVATGDVLMCGNDDMVFVTEGWASLLLAEANRYPDGVFDIGVSTHNETHYPFSIVSRKAVETMGFLYDPRIFWGDIFLRDVMAAFGRAVMLPSVRIAHDWAGQAPDQTFLEGQGWRSGAHMDAHPAAVAEAVEKLRGLQ